MLMLFIEAILVGILMVIVGSFVGVGFSIINRQLQPSKKISDTNWNKYFVMEQSLFFTGFFVHLLCEIVGINKWYCKNGYATLV